MDLDPDVVARAAQAHLGGLQTFVANGADAALIVDDVRIVLAGEHATVGLRFRDGVVRVGNHAFRALAGEVTLEGRAVWVARHDDLQLVVDGARAHARVGADAAAEAALARVIVAAVLRVPLSAPKGHRAGP